MTVCMKRTGLQLLGRILGVAIVVALATATARPALAENNCTATTELGFATDIAHGHAFTKHHAEFVHGKVIDGLAFSNPTIASAADFATFLDGILNAPSNNKTLANNRHAYWDASTGTVIITNLKPADCGTAFRPTAGKTYYDGLT